MKITFHFQSATTLRQRTQLKRFIGKIFKLEKHTLASISFIFCDDAYLLEINRSFLNHDYFTDIITFDLTQKDQTEISAEIYISIDRVKENARLFNVLLNQELHRVIFHGMLHLCGYGDKSKSDKALMTKMENKYLKLYKLF
jgi:rRNA maturation RNase YbeY